MDLTREFLEKVEEMVQPQTLTEGIRTFVDKPMHMLVDEIAADTPLHTNSLSSVADYIKSNADFDVRFCWRLPGYRPSRSASGCPWKISSLACRPTLWPMNTGMSSYLLWRR